MEHLDLVQKYLQGRGVEIGAFKSPIPGVSPIYVDMFETYANEPTLAEFYGDACQLPFHDSSLDYVATSHVIEHVANPLLAFKEWVRVLKHGGIIYMVVPDRRRIFDHPRLLTDPTHILDDYLALTTQSDSTHIDEFVYGVDWAQYSPSTNPKNVSAARDDLAKLYHGAVQNGGPINIHFHTFESSNIKQVISIGNERGVWNGSMVIDLVCEGFPDSCPNGFLVVAKVRKPLIERVHSLFSIKGLKDNARRFQKANKSLDPTPTAVTDAAKQPPRQL